MHMVAAGQTDVGRRREHNEDAYLIDPRLALYIVCDGVGGHAAGEVASHKTVSVVQEVIHRHRAILDAYLTSPSDPQLNAVMHLVEEAVQEACSCLYTIGEREPSKKGMGTTIAMLLALQKTVIVAHAGDSRVYLIRDHHLQQLTEDHSLAGELMKAGMLEREQLKTWPLANVITRCVGSQPTVQVDTRVVECHVGDRFLLCSDGFHNYLHDDDEDDALLAMSTRLTPAQLVTACVAFANDHGGQDNITVIVTEVAALA